MCMRSTATVAANLKPDTGVKPRCSEMVRVKVHDQWTGDDSWLFLLKYDNQLCPITVKNKLTAHLQSGRHGGELQLSCYGWGYMAMSILMYLALVEYTGISISNSSSSGGNGGGGIHILCYYFCSGGWAINHIRHVRLARSLSLALPFIRRYLKRVRAAQILIRAQVSVIYPWQLLDLGYPCTHKHTYTQALPNGHIRH